MSFSKYMNNLPNQREETIKKIAEITCSSDTSVCRWINGTQIPPLIKQKIIADYLGKKKEDLFPANKGEMISKREKKLQ
jgi:hypothetical protein